ncbi:transporter substrate-binding domain-containing protein [Atopomonas sediminilitoris]|uniref:transporter substrate-binding domain-containing protein n=1 Tax=Atopomonas sediminilitoris TaxID=2919919 RepID=UPI001F4EAFFB|nr:transporter substrate-binding domain-containing protein [Atopomonas sediminilitoris]MCJ8169566.1 transporter substrate-binding domain-containing protein [Atopomonas sediminilitoris]
MLRSRLLVPLLVFSLLQSALAGAVRAQNLELLMIEYPPYTSTTLADGGFTVALLQKTLHGSPFTVQLRSLPPARVQHTMSRTSGWDASLMPPAAEVSRQHLSNIALDNQGIRISLFRRQPTGDTQAFTWQTFADLAPGSVAMTRSYTASPRVHALQEAGLEIMPIDELSQAFAMLRRKRVDYVMAAEASGWYVLNQQGAQAADYQFAEQDLLRVPNNLWINLASPNGQALRHYLVEQLSLPQLYPSVDSAQP